MTLAYLAVDQRSPVPLYHQIAEQIRAAVDARHLSTGSSLGSEKRLADELRVSLPTVRRAFEVLASEGVVTRRPGVGTFVSGVGRPSALQAVATAPANQEPSRCRVACMGERLPEPPVKERLALESGIRVWHFVRVKQHGGMPSAILENFLTAGATPSDRTRHARSASDEDLLSSTGLEGMVHHEIKALAAGGWLAQKLQASQGTPLIVLERTVFAGDGNPVEFARHSYLASHYKFEAKFALGRT